MPYRTSASVFVTTQFTNFHRWKDAPPTQHYLSNLHRHLFMVRFEISVGGLDREVEYHRLLAELDEYIKEGLMTNWDTGWSCEQMARMIADWMSALHPDRHLYACTVSEDGENGSTVELRD